MSTTSVSKLAASATIDDVMKEVRGVRADLSLVAGDVHAVKDRIRLVEKRLDGHDELAKVAGAKEQRISEKDLAHEAAIGSLVVDVNGLKTDVASLKETQATQLAILQRLDRLAANPLVRRLAWVVGTAVLSYLASKGWAVK